MEQTIAQITDYAGLTILGVLGLTMLISVLYGLKRGLGKSLVRFITVAISAAASFIAAKSALGMLSPIWEGKTILELTRLVPGLSESLPENMVNLLSSFEAEAMMPLVSLMVSLFILPILFVAVFYLVKLVSWIVFFILSCILGFMKRKKNGLSRLLGAAVGAAQGLVICAVIMTPIVGILSIPDALRAPLSSEELPENTVAAAEELYSYVAPLTQHPAVKLCSKLGVKKLYDGIASVQIEDQRYVATEELSSLGYICVDAMPLAGINFASPTPEQEASIRGILDEISQDPFLSHLIAGTLRGTATAFGTGAMVFPLDEPFNTLGVEMISIFREAEPDNYGDDLETILNVYFILAEHGVMSTEGKNGDSIANALVTEVNGQKAIDRIIEELRSNDHTKHLVSTITRLSISIMCDNMDIGEDAAQIYESVKSGVADTLSISKEQFATEEEYKAQVSQSLDNTLKSNGIRVEAEVLEGMTNYINDNSEQLSGMSDEDLDAVILSYYGAYADYLNSNPEGTPDDFLEDMNKDDIPEGGLEAPEGGVEDPEGGLEGSDE